MTAIDLAAAFVRNPLTRSRAARPVASAVAAGAAAALAAPRTQNTATLLGQVANPLTAPRVARPGITRRSAVCMRQPGTARTTQRVAATHVASDWPMSDAAKWATDLVNADSKEVRHEAASSLLCVTPDALSEQLVESFASQLRELAVLVEETGELSAAADAVIEKVWTELYLAD